MQGDRHETVPGQDPNDTVYAIVNEASDDTSRRGCSGADIFLDFLVGSYDNAASIHLFYFPI